MVLDSSINDFLYFKCKAQLQYLYLGYISEILWFFIISGHTNLQNSWDRRSGPTNNYKWKQCWISRTNIWNIIWIKNAE